MARATSLSNYRPVPGNSVVARFGPDDLGVEFEAEFDELPPPDLPPRPAGRPVAVPCGMLSTLLCKPS